MSALPHHFFSTVSYPVKPVVPPPPQPFLVSDSPRRRPASHDVWLEEIMIYAYMPGVGQNMSYCKYHDGVTPHRILGTEKGRKVICISCLEDSKVHIGDSD